MRIGDAVRSSALEPREARLLLAAATGFSEASVLAHPEKDIPEKEKSVFREMAERRAKGEPVAYLLGRKEFYGLEFVVNAAVLIPRPETELLVELALRRNPRSLLDLGTGCGAIALALKAHLPKARVVAVEASLAALRVARRNAARLGRCVDFRHGLWFGPVAAERFEVIVSNPPYVSSGDAHLTDLRFEPRAALIAGADGLDAIRGIIPRAPAHLAPGGWLLLEHGLGQASAVCAQLGRSGLEDVQSWPDLAGIRRVSGAKLGH